MALTGTTFFLMTSANFLGRRFAILSLGRLEESFLVRLTLCASGVIGREFTMSADADKSLLQTTVYRSLGVLAGMQICALAYRSVNKPVSWIPFAVSMVIIDNFLWLPLVRKSSINNIENIKKELIRYHHYDLLPNQIRILGNKRLIRDHQTDFDVYLGRKWRWRSSDAISDGRRYRASASADELDAVVQRLEMYLKKMENLSPYTGEKFKNMSGLEMKAIEEEMLKGNFALNRDQMEEWNKRVETLRDVVLDADSYQLVWFSTTT